MTALANHYLDALYFCDSQTYNQRLTEKERDEASRAATTLRMFLSWLELTHEPAYVQLFSAQRLDSKQLAANDR